VQVKWLPATRSLPPLLRGDLEQAEFELRCGWRELLGEFTAQEIWEMRRKGDFWVAQPVREGHELVEGPNGRGGRP
jgi:hypothetical protein